MSKILLGLLPIFLILLLSCSGGEDTKNTEKTTPKNAYVKGADAKRQTSQTNQTEYQTDEGKNQPPQITSIRIASASDGESRDGFRVDVEGQDPDGDEVSFRYQWKKNEEDIMGAVEEVLPWQEDFRKGDYISVEIVPFDGEDEGIWRSEEGFTIPNSPPKIVSAPEDRMDGGRFTYEVKAEDPDGDPIEFALKNAPKGMTVEPTKGVISWEFGEDDVGEYRVEVIASDPEGANDVQVLALTVPSEIP